MFREVQEEIEKKRKEMTEQYDQKSEIYRDKLEKMARRIMESDSGLPSWQIDKLIEEVIRPYSDVLWIEGAPPPLLKEYKASIKLKPGASGVVRQPYKLSKYDELRASYHHEVWEREGKSNI